MNKQKIQYAVWFLALVVLDRITKHMALGMLSCLRADAVFRISISFQSRYFVGKFHSEHHGFFVGLTLCIVGIIAVLARHTISDMLPGAVYMPS